MTKPAKFYQKSFFAIGIFFVLLLSTILFIIRPTIKSIRKLNEEIAAHRTYLESRYVKRQNIRRVLIDFKKIVPELDDLLDKKIIVKRNQEIEFITWLERAGAENGLRQKIEFDTEKGEELNHFLFKIPFRINLSGNFIQTLKYFRELEKSQRYIIVSNISIVSPKFGNVNIPSEGIVNTIIDGHFYMAK